MEHAFSKWLERSSESERAKAPEIVRALEAKPARGRGTPRHHERPREREDRRAAAEKPVPPYRGAARGAMPGAAQQPSRRADARPPVAGSGSVPAVQGRGAAIGTAATGSAGSRSGPAARSRAAAPAQRERTHSNGSPQPPQQSAIPARDDPSARGSVRVATADRSTPIPHFTERRSAAKGSQEADPSRRASALVAEGDSLYYEPKKMPAPALDPIELLPPAPRSDCLVYSTSSSLGSTVLVREPPTPLSGRRLGGIRRLSQTVRVQVGLDFGTSCTKVMYQRLGPVERVIRPMDFGHGLEDCPAFALPSVAAFDRNGELLLGDVAARRLGGGWGRGLTRFKMLTAGRHTPRFLDEPLDARFRAYVKLALGSERACPPEVLAATYLAFVMRRVRRYLEREFDSAELDVRYNTCVPVDQRQNDAVYAVFQRMAAVAQKIEEKGRDDDTAKTWLERALEFWPQVCYDEHGAQTRVFLVPEAVAATAGYLTSLARESGLHALVDIGAGTTDVSIFQVSLARRSGLTTLWYAARSIPMGAGRIEEMVATALRTTAAGASVTTAQVLRALSGDPDYRAICGRLVKHELTRMWNGTTKAWSEAYGKEPQQSSWTRTKVRVFLAGGGALIPEAASVFSQAWMRGWGPYPTRVVPEPDTGVARSGLPFARLCVAFGLATPVAELGNYAMPAEVKPMQRVVLPRRSYEQEGDQLLPRYGWT